MDRGGPHAVAMALMDAFAGRTGLMPPGPTPRRYLWTDAFAVCNFLGLHQATGEARCRELVLALVGQVHRVLGRHRPDDPRTGWLSGLSEEEGALHPTVGGLRIGKELPELGPEAPRDPEREWDRDGQYYHYLTRWMSTLHRVGLATRELRFHRWARELAATAHARFTHRPRSGGTPRLYWKMSVDLSRPLVSSMGQHDPLDGLVTFCELQTGPSGGGPDLGAELAELATMCRDRDWATDDPLGLGGLILDAVRIARLAGRGADRPMELLEAILDGVEAGMEAWARRDPLQLPSWHRLAFRELGLAIGVRTAQTLDRLPPGPPDSLAPSLRTRLADLARFSDLAARIEAFWLREENRRASAWTAHQDINEVMLATSLAPEGLLAA